MKDKIPSLSIMPTKPLWAIGLYLLAGALASCATEPYQSQPLTPQASLTRIKEQNPNSADFHAYLIKQGYKSSELPIATWGLRELTLCALFYHAKLDVAKAQYGLALAAIDSAGIQQPPSIGGHVSHSNQKNDDLSPWAFGLQVDIPIQTTNKRAIKVEEAQHLAEAARLDIADTAWQIRLAIATDLLQLHENTANIAQLNNMLASHEKIINMLQKRVAAGLNSNTDLSNYKLAQQQLQFSLTTAQAKTAEIRARLAADCGLSVEKLNQLNIQTLDLDAALKQQQSVLSNMMTSEALQEITLLNRIDIRSALAKYAAAESKIKLEIAKQTPDISLSPGLAFEFGDTIWSLGINALLSFAQKNKTMIAETKQLREIEAAQFEALQTQTLANLAQVQTQYQAANETLTAQRQWLAAQTAQHEKQQKQFDAGLIDRLAFTQSGLNQQLALQQLQTAQFAVLQAALRLEDVMQYPIEVTSMLPSELMP
ncbi:MAG TPA: TolC family protein [Methylotenera sp.]|nr:TolC family protein [Methylotenera sp.]HPH04466.1 TolC family protein [Methylotenera sp.]HPN00871.1 TolC family protein [Methylotenera sp.]